MNKQRPLLLLALVAYVFAPIIYGWVTDPTSAWYKPYIVWALVVVIAYIIQGRDKHHDA